VDPSSWNREDPEWDVKLEVRLRNLEVGSIETRVGIIGTRIDNSEEFAVVIPFERLLEAPMFATGGEEFTVEWHYATEDRGVVFRSVTVLVL
jgi:hypothetical protein